MNVDQPAIKKTKRDDLTAKPQGLSLHGTKRAALGTINGNTRKQPSRAAKQVSEFANRFSFLLNEEKRHFLFFIFQSTMHVNDILLL